MKSPDYIVWHTAMHYSKKRDRTFDTTKADLYQWHVVERNWSDIGYHFLVRWDGTVVECRPLRRRGAHVSGLNHTSIGICFSGDGDHEALKPAQLEAGLALTKRLQDQFMITTSKVIGHKEIRILVEKGKLARKYLTSKSCPGTFVDMDEMRKRLMGTYKEVPNSNTCSRCSRCKKSPFAT